MNIDFDELHVFDNSLGKHVPIEMLEKAQAESDRRLALLDETVTMLISIEVLRLDWIELSGEPVFIRDLVTRIRKEIKDE